MADFTLTADVKLANRTTAETQIRDIERRLSGSGSLALGKLTGQASEFEKSLAAANARVLAFGASAGIIAGVSTAIRGMVTETIKVEKTLTDINVLLGKSSKGIEQFGNSLFSIAKSTGQSFFDVAEAAKEFSRQGLSAEETLKRTSDAMILTRLTGLDLEKSVSGLTATVNGFAKEMLTTTEIVNRMANVDAQFAVSSKDMVEALSRSSQVAEDAGVSFNEFIAVVTALQQRTARGGAVIGNSLKTIFTRLQRPETLDDLEKFGIAVRDAGGATLPMMDLLRNLVGAYGDLSAAQKTSVSSLAGGVYQINMVKALFSDLGKTVPEYAKALSVANRATDEAIQRNAALNKSMSATANEAGQNILKMASAGGNLVFGPSIKKVLGGVNQLGEFMDGEGLGQKLGAGLLKGIGNALAGPGLILATVLGAKLFGAFLKYSTGALSTISGIGEASGRILNMQHGIVEMSQQDARIKEILGNTLTSHIQKQTAILAIMREQVAAQQLLNSSARSVATGLTMRGVTYNPGANVKIKGLAGGYIPASQIPAQHVMKEVAQASAAGYSISPANVRAMQTTINGAPTTVVYNDKEKVVDNFMGTGEPAIIPPTGRFMNFAGGYKMFPGTKIPTQLNGLLPDGQFTKAFGALDEWFSGLKVKSGKIPRVKFHRDNALFEKEGAAAFYEPDANRINLSISGAYSSVSNLPTPESRNYAAKRQLGSQLLHEGFHGGFANINPSARRALLDKVGGGVFGSSTSLREAAKLISTRFGPAAGKEFMREYGHLEYPAEELAAMKFPTSFGFPALHAAGGILTRKKLLGAFPYSKGGARLGTVEFKEKSDALILDMVTTKMGPDGNRLQGTGILNFAFEQLLRRAKKGGYARVGFTPINGKVIGKAQKLFGKKDSLGNPIDFGNDVFLDTNKFGHLFESVKNAAGGSDWLQELLEKEKLRDARIAAAKQSLLFTGAQSSLPYPLLAGSMGEGVQEALLKLETERASGSYAASRPTSPRAETLAQTKEALSAQSALLRAEANNPSSPIVEVNSFRGGEARSQEGSASSVSLTRQQEEHQAAIKVREKKLIALHMRRADEGYLGPATPLPESFKQEQRMQGTWRYNKDVTNAHRPGSQPKDQMALIDNMVSVKPQGKSLGKRWNEARTMAFDWGAWDEAAEDKKYGKIAPLSPNATPEQKADHDRATQARNQRLQSKQQAHAQTSQRLMLASFATPVLGGMVTSGIDQSTLAGQAKARTAQGVTSAIGTGIMLGTAVGGPLGAGVGLLVGSIMTIKAAFDGLTPSVEELAEEAKKETEKDTAKHDTLRNIVEISAALEDGGGTPAQVRERKRVLAQKMTELSSEERDTVIEAGGKTEKLQEILGRDADAKSRAAFASRVKVSAKAMSETGFKGKNDLQDLASLMAGTADISNLSKEDLEEKSRELEETGSAGLVKRGVVSQALRGIALSKRDEAKTTLLTALQNAEKKVIEDGLRTIQEQGEQDERRKGVIRRNFSLFMAASNAQSKMFTEGSRQERLGRYVNAAIEHDGRNVESRGNLRNIYSQGFGDYYSESAKRDIESASRVEQMEQGFNGGEMQRKLSAMDELRQVGSGGISSALESLREAAKDSIDISQQERLNKLSTGVLKGFGGIDVESIGKDNFGMPQGEMEQLLGAAKLSQKQLAEEGDTDKAQKFTTAITALERSFEDATEATQRYQDGVAIATAAQRQQAKNLTREFIAQAAVGQFKNVMAGYRFSEGLTSGPQNRGAVLDIGKTSAALDQWDAKNKNEFTTYGSAKNMALATERQNLLIERAKSVESAASSGLLKTREQIIDSLATGTRGVPVEHRPTIPNKAEWLKDFNAKTGRAPGTKELAQFESYRDAQLSKTPEGQEWAYNMEALTQGYKASFFQNSRKNLSERGASVAEIFGQNGLSGTDSSSTASYLRKLAADGKVEDFQAKASQLLSSKYSNISPTQRKALESYQLDYGSYQRQLPTLDAAARLDAEKKLGGRGITKDLLSNQTFTDGMQELQKAATDTSAHTKESMITLSNIFNSIEKLQTASITNITVTSTDPKKLEELLAQYSSLAKDVETLKKDAPPRNFTPTAKPANSDIATPDGGAGS